MYCECKTPKSQTMLVLDKSFKVCAKRQGGCGKEISDKPAFRSGHINLSLYTVPCKKCNGTGQVSPAYSLYGGSGKAKCETCKGFGIIADGDGDDDYDGFY